jgi:hypothetical protein
MHDVNEIAALLHIHEKASAHAGALEHIKNAAWAKLQDLNLAHAPASPAPNPPAAEPAAKGDEEETTDGS